MFAATDQWTSRTGKTPSCFGRTLKKEWKIIVLTLSALFPDGTAHLINIWCYVWFQMRCSGWDPSPHFHLSHSNMQSARDAQQAESGGHRVNLQHGVVPRAAPLVAPKRLSVVRALWLTLQGYTEIARDGGPWSSWCLFNSWLLLDLFIYFKNANVWQKVPCLRFLLWKPRKKRVGAVSWLYF